jgi:hypothetical protein
LLCEFKSGEQPGIEFVVNLLSIWFSMIRDRKKYKTGQEQADRGRQYEFMVNVQPGEAIGNTEDNGDKYNIDSVDVGLLYYTNNKRGAEPTQEEKFFNRVAYSIRPNKKYESY